MADFISFGPAALILAAVVVLEALLLIERRRTAEQARKADSLQRKFKSLKRAYFKQHDDNRALGKELVRLQKDIGNLKRVSGNMLYRNSLEDKQAQVVQAAMQIKLAQDALNTARNIMEVGKDLPK